ncbi:TonB-dependent receptor [Helicobacter sp. MIT 21-1697]|uniref:TonB-dependent receptor plug domain-containing protein n=1 Tax=Helicobacter sp. MIT 21-1697 TaxID=2993733 RepID=UPI00224AD00B|nr:TonB-dependent receptor [Helicobacter sp. MIT 21-1697]MCX2716645.1 TonB-dependent receptor [Helicobacter sp. MIT 21-1697]
MTIPIFKNSPLLSFSFVSMCGIGLFADESFSHTKLSPIISAAHPISNANVSVIDDTFLNHTQASNLREIFAKDAEIQVGGGANIAQKLYIRGFEDRMFRVRLDGITQGGNLFHHQGNLLIDPFLIKSIEIEKGLAKPEDGAGALAGGINITTKNAFDLLSQKRNYGAHFVLGGQSNKGVDTALAAYGKLTENLGLLVSYGFDDMPYYRAGNGDKVPSSKTRSHNALFKLSFLPNANHSLNLNYHFNNVNAIAPYGANVILEQSPKLYDNALFSHSLSTQYAYAPADNFALSWNTFYSYKNLKLSPIGAASTTHDHEKAHNLSLHNFGSDIMLKHYFSPSRHYIKYGLNYQFLTTKEHNLNDGHDRGRNNQGHELGAIYGGFIGANFNFLESLSLDVGSRYDVFTYRDKYNAKHNTQGLSPYISLLYTPTNELSFKITQNYNTRGVMPLDASLLYDPHVKIARLKAEGMHNTEFDMDYDNSLFSAHIALYHQYLKNFINTYVNNASNTAVHGSENFSRQNMDSAIRILGYEANIGLDFSFVDVHLGVAQNFPTYNNKTITDTFELMAVSGRSYYLSAGLRPFSALPQFQILWLSRFSEGIDYQGYNMYRGELASINKKAYNVHNIYFTYDVKSYLSLRLAFLNITNKTYANPYTPLNELYSNGNGNTPLYEPGFSTKFQIALSF